MYLGRSPCCLMSSPLVPPSGYFQLCTQDNDVFWAHPCSQGDNACDFNDYVAFPLGSTSSSKFFILNLPPTQIVGCNEHCCAWDLLAESFASSFVLFASSFCYSMTTRPHAVCEESVVADGKPMCPCSCHPLPSCSWFDSHSATVSAYRQFRNVADLSVSKLFNPVSWAQLSFFFSLNNPKKLDWLKWHVLSREDTNNFDFCLFADCKPLSDGRDEYGLSLRLLRYNFGRVNSSEHQKS